MKKRLVLSLLFLFAITAIPVSLFSQATASGSITGTVTDPSQAVVSGASVTVVSLSTDAKRTTTTNTSGSYRFDLLSAGNYKLTVTSSGFSTVTENFEIMVGQTVSANVSLHPGATTQTVEVEAENPLIDTTKTSVSAEITPTEVQELPMVGQDAADLAYLAPGVKQTDSYDPTKNRYAILSVNGDGGRNVNVTVNGVDNKDNTVGGPVMQLPLEAVQEYSISTQRFSAENGRSEGAAINIITKRGSNQFHGTAVGFFRDTALDTDETDADGHGGTTSSHPDYTRQQFGGAIGGPLKKDKAFLFFAINREREHQAQQEQTQPYKELVAAQPFFGDLDKPSATIPRPFFETRYNGRADYTFTPREAIYLAYNSQANDSLNDQSDGSGDLNNGNFTVNHLQLANLTVNSLLSDTTVNTATFGFQYWNNLIASKISSPLVTFNALAESFGTNTNVPQQSYQRKWQFKDDFSKQVGKHTLKGGVDYIWNPVEGGFFEFNSTLEIDFTDDPSTILADSGTYPQGFQTPGAVSGMSISNGNPYFLVATKQLGFYFQDDWKTTRRLTLSLGLRWDKDYNMIGGSDIKNSRTYLDLRTVNSSVTNPYVSSIAKDDNLDFSPRVGFAYDVTGKGNHVVRGGFGLYYGNVFQNIPLFMEQMANPTVFQTVLSLSNSCPVGSTPAGCTSDDVPGTGKQLGQWAYGTDAMPTIPPPSTQLAFLSVGRLMDPKYRNPVTEEFNGGYTWAVNQSTVVEAEYTHVMGIHENKTMNRDQRIPINGNLARPLHADFAASSIADREPASVRVDSAIGREHYDGMNFSLRSRVASRLNLTANYTLAWAYGYGTGGGSFRNYPKLATAPFASWEWGPSPNDERHHITVAGVFNLPKGFEIAPIMQYGSARPFDLTNSGNTLNTGSGTAIGVVVPKGDPKNYFAFAGNNTGAQDCYYGLHGASAACSIAKYDPLRGDPFFQLDARLGKTFKFGEKANVQLIAEAFNLTKRANFGNNYGNSIGNSKTFNHPQGFIGPSSVIIPRATWGEMGARFTF